jgi:exodeoxyribonuclease VII small subunit
MQQSFNANYAKLNEIANKLRNQTEPDIDALVPMVAEATKAYEVCKARIADVKKALEEYMQKNDINQG